MKNGLQGFCIHYHKMLEIAIRHSDYLCNVDQSMDSFWETKAFFAAVARLEYFDTASDSAITERHHLHHIAACAYIQEIGFN